MTDDQFLVVALLAVWTAMSALVGHFGRGRGHRVFGVFLVSMLFSPLIGTLIAFTKPGLGTNDQTEKRERR